MTHQDKGGPVATGTAPRQLTRHGASMNSVSPPHPAYDDRATKLYGPPPAPRGSRRALSGTAPDGLRAFKDVKPGKVRWLWPGRLPAGALVVLEGDPGVGKSTVALDLAAGVSAGRKWPDGSRCPRGGVIVLSAEDSEGIIRARLDAAGADLGQVFTQSSDDELLTLPSGIGRIEKWIRERKVRLLIVDVLPAYLGQTVNAHNDQDIRSALAPLAKMARSTGVCVLVIRHLNKTTGQAAMYRGGGSIAIVGQARAGYLAAKDRDSGQLALVCVKSNWGELPRALTYRLVPDCERGCARVEWGGEASYTADGLLSDPADQSKPSSAVRAATEWLRVYLNAAKGHRARSREIISHGGAQGFSRTTLQTAKDNLGLKVWHQRGMQNPPWWWGLPDASEAFEDSEDSGAQTPESSEPSESKAPALAAGTNPGQAPDRAPGQAARQTPEPT